MMYKTFKSMKTINLHVLTFHESGIYSYCTLLVQKIQKTVKNWKCLLHRNIWHLVYLVNRESPLISPDNEIYNNQEPVNLSS